MHPICASLVHKSEGRKGEVVMVMLVGLAKLRNGGL